MKKQKSQNKPTRLWQAFEEIPGLAAVKAEWRSLLGDELPVIEHLLQMQSQLATSYPRLERSGIELPLRVVDHGDGSYVGVCDETGETIALCRDDLIVFGLNHKKFSENVAATFHLRPASLTVGNLRMPLIVGYTSAAEPHIPVVFASPRDSAELFGNVTNWISEHSRRCVWLTPTRRFWSPRVEQAIHSNHCGLFALQDLIEIDEVGDWTGQPAARQVSGFGAKTIASGPLSEQAQTGDVRTVYHHYHAGQKLYVCVVNEQKAPFDFSVNQFRSVEQLANHQDACLLAESRMDQRADFGCSYSARIDLSRLAAELDKGSGSSEGPVFSVHWLVQIGDEPQLREDTVLRDSCRMRYVGGRFAAVDRSSEEMFDEELTFAKKQKWLDERRNFRNESIEQREELSSRLFHTTQSANVGEVLRIFALSVMQWARGLKRHTFDHFYLDMKDPWICRMYQVPPAAGFEFQPYWITEPWIGMQATYDLLEFHKSPEFAKALAARVQTLLDARLAFSARIVEETARHGHDVDLETFVGIEEERKVLKHIAFSLCEHLNLLASQFDALRNGGIADAAAQVVTPAPHLTGTEADPATEAENVLQRRGQFWISTFGGETVYLKDSVGLAYIARLLSEPNRDIAAVSLLAARVGIDPRVVSGSSGPILDDKARAEYSRRYEDQQEELVEAEANNDLGRIAKIQAEMELLMTELASAAGLGGRSRQQTDAEKVRKSVSMAVTREINKIAREHKSLAAHLGAFITSGTIFRYAPEPPIDWLT